MPHKMMNSQIADCVERPAEPVGIEKRGDAHQETCPH